MAGAVGRLAEVLEQQTHVRSGKPSNITVEPQIQWPAFGDHDDDADGFFEDVEEICGLANNGQGMAPKEMIRTLGGCLKGSRKQEFNDDVRSARAKAFIQSNPEFVYQALVERLGEFKEGAMEKQQRLNREWGELKRGKKTALEFLPVFEGMVAEMELAGLGKSDRDLLLPYLG